MPRRWRRNSARTSRQGITPSQTVGPFFKYGLTPNGKYDWNDAFTNNLVTPDTSGERIRVEGRVFDGDGAAGAGLHAGDLAGRRAGTLFRSAGQARAAEFDVQGVRPLRHRSERRLCVRHHQAGQVPDPDGKPQAPHLLLAIFARGMLLHNLHADLFRRRGGQCRRSRSWRWCRPIAAPP